MCGVVWCVMWCLVCNVVLVFGVQCCVSAWCGVLVWCLMCNVVSGV